jgi:hypothetical protein
VRQAAWDVLLVREAAANTPKKRTTTKICFFTMTHLLGKWHCESALVRGICGQTELSANEIGSTRGTNVQQSTSEWRAKTRRSGQHADEAIGEDSTDCRRRVAYIFAN